MPYPRNTHRWKVGDLVIHCADAKRADMLMRVIGYDLKTDECITQYVQWPHEKQIHRKHQRHNIWRNDIKYLMNPRGFDIETKAVAS